jgi:hypothetical protein
MLPECTGTPRLCNADRPLKVGYPTGDQTNIEHFGDRRAMRAFDPKEK